MLKADKSPLFIRAYNKTAPLVGLKGSLDFDRLIRKARNNTGLSYLGKDFNADALELLIRSINDEAELHPFGTLMIREKLISQLENRLWAEHWFRKHPEILEEKVLPIVLITGLQRTGTTKMQRMLSSMEGARALKSWEALYPAPLGNALERNRRLSRTKRNERAVKWISPTFQHIHPIYHDKPEEDLLLLDLHFMSSSSEAILHIPTYADWLKNQSQKEAYEYERKLLLLLQWQQGGRFWVLKSPHHLEYLPEFTQVFPDTRIIWMHRSLDTCIPSFMSMLYHGRSMFSKHVDPADITRHWIEKLGQMLDAGIQFRAVGESPVWDISYQAFIQDELRILGEISQRFPELSIPLTLPPQTKPRKPYRSQHQYNLEDWGLTPSEISERFQNYHQLFSSLETAKYGESR